MITYLKGLRSRLRGYFAPHPCGRCGAPSAVLYCKVAVHVEEGTGGTSIGIRVNHRTPPPEWLCRACAKVAMK